MRAAEPAPSNPKPRPLAIAATLLAAIFVGFAIPAAWLWVGSRIQGSAGARPLTFLAMVVIIGGIVASYLALMSLAGRLLKRRDPEAARARRDNWNRSLSASRKRPPALGSLEQVFVNAAMLAGVAYIAWFLLFAGSSLPLPGPP